MNVELIKTPWSFRDMRWLKPWFEDAFPPEERPPFFVLYLRSNKGVDWWKIYAGGRLTGFFYVMANRELAYIFYFAIHPEFRGRGIGTAALKALLRKYRRKRLFLAVEQADPSAKNYAARVKRREFYLRNGLQDLGQKVQEGSVVYDLLGTGGAVRDEEYQSLIQPWMFWPLRDKVTMKILEEEKQEEAAPEEASEEAPEETSEETAEEASEEATEETPEEETEEEES